MPLKKSIHPQNYIKSHPGTSLLAAVWILEIFYVATTPSAITRIKFRHMFGSFKEYKIKFLCLVAIVLVFLGFFSLVMHISLVLLLAVFFTTGFLLINASIQIHFPKKSVEAMTQEECLRQAKTGDFLVCGTPHISDNLFYLVPAPFLGIAHIGLVVKGPKDSAPYVIDCMEQKRFCEYSKRKKTGVMMRNMADHFSYLPRTKIYLIRNQWDTKLDEDRIMSVFERHKDIEYFQNNLNCITFVLLFLQELRLVVTPYDPLPLYVHFNRLIDPGFYRVPYDYQVNDIVMSSVKN